MIREVLITGLGPVTSNGVGCDALWHSILAGQPRVQRRLLPVDVGRMIELPMAAMPPVADVPGLSNHVSFLTEQGCDCYRDLAYTLLAIELAMFDAGLSHDRSNNRIGVIQAFEAPGVECTVSRLFQLMTPPPPPGGPPQVYDLLAQHFYNMQAFLYVHLVGKALGLHGFSTSVHNACSSGAYAIELAAERIRCGEADVMIVAGGEAFDTAVRLEWFQRLQLYDMEGCMRPFHANPSGFYVGEGACAIVLESSEHVARRSAKTYARYLGGAFAHQAWKQTIPDVRAGLLGDVIQSALVRTKVSWPDVDLIAPHGASTLLSDGYERDCLATAIDASGVKTGAAACAFKPYIGHMLAASGVIEVAALLLCMKHGRVPAMPNSAHGTCTLPVFAPTSVTERPIGIALKLSTGFTGHDAAALFASV